VQIKVIYDYYSSKCATPLFIGEEELLEYDFQAEAGTRLNFRDFPTEVLFEEAIFPSII